MTRNTQDLGAHLSHCPGNSIVKANKLVTTPRSCFGLLGDQDQAAIGPWKKEESGPGSEMRETGNAG